MLKEFKEFALKGNVIDMAVGVIIGGAFSTIVSSLVNDIFMPILGLLTGKINFSELYISLDGVDYPTLADAKAVSAPVFCLWQFYSKRHSISDPGFCCFTVYESDQQAEAACTCGSSDNQGLSIL